MKQVILNADDFAFNAAVSSGIVSLAQKGRLSATSAMVLSPRWAQDVPALAELRGQIDVGLHLDWNAAPFGLPNPWAPAIASLCALIDPDYVATPAAPIEIITDPPH